MRELIILRGLPGSGKSRVAEMLASRHDAVICCADDYFIVNGQYCFEGNRLSAAHAFCQGKARKAMMEGKERVIIDNTNTDPLHFRPYEEAAKQYGYTVVHMIIENRHGGRSRHRVPSQSVLRGLDRMMGSLSLAGSGVFDED